MMWRRRAAASAVAAAASAAAAAVSAAAAAAVSGWEVASEAEAQAGTDNTKVMTPLRVANAIDEQAIDETTEADYAATSTITGFSSYTLKQIYYKKIGNTCIISFALEGVSNAATLSFTAPYTNSAKRRDMPLSIGIDNGVSQHGGVQSVYMAASSNVITIDRNGSATGWTNSGTKGAYGMMIFECA
jgi:hypothetical protein